MRVLYERKMRYEIFLIHFSPVISPTHKHLIVFSVPTDADYDHLPILIDISGINDFWFSQEQLPPTLK